MPPFLFTHLFTELSQLVYGCYFGNVEMLAMSMLHLVAFETPGR